MATVLVTGGDERAALAVARSLGRAEHRVVVGSRTGRSLAGASRFAAADVRLGDSLREPAAYLDRLHEVVEREGVEVVLPVTEADLLAVLSEKAALAPVKVPFPDLAQFRAASDKTNVMRLADGVGLSVPAQSEVGREEAAALPARAEGPTVLKPGRSVAGGAKLGVSYVPEGGPLRERVEELPDAAFPLLVQERVTGPGVGVFMLRWDGRILAEMAHRRLREKPPAGGVSVVRESVALDPGIRRMAAELLEALDWNGVAMVELKLDGRTGRPYIMEVNGRFWGSLQLAIDAGVDFPRLLVDAVLGRTPDTVVTGRVGVRSRWLLGDLDQLLLRLLRSPRALDLPPDADGRGQAVADFLKSFLPPTRLEVLRWTDPAPFVRELGGWVGSVVGRAREARGSRGR